MKETNRNFLYNLIYQIFVFLIPLVTTPYISRVLGVENIGIYSYTYSIVYYFMLAIMLGINNYGAREIAKVQNSKTERSKKFFSIYGLQLFNSIVVILIFLIFLIFSKYEYKNIMYIQFIYLLSTMFDINWFYFGMEKFKITISRNIIIKLLSLVCIFLFIKNSNDLPIYTLILSGSTLISQLYLWLFIRKDIIFTKVKVKDIYNNLKPCLILFIPVIAYSIYRVMDKTMIGYFSNVEQLGNYESAEKIINIPMSIITALGTVMMPHMSKLSEDKFNSKIKYTYKLCFFMIYPILIGLLIVSKDFCKLFFGEGYGGTPIIINMLLITVLFSCITNITRSNYLIPKSQDKIYVTSTIYGAIINFILNIIFIKKFGAYGACIGTIAAEFTVMVYQVYKTKRKIKYFENLKSTLPFLSSSILMGLIIYLIGLLNLSNDIKILVQVFVALIIYLLLNIRYIKNDFLNFRYSKTKERKGCKNI